MNIQLMMKNKQGLCSKAESCLSLYLNLHSAGQPEYDPVFAVHRHAVHELGERKMKFLEGNKAALADGMEAVKA